MSPLSHSVFSRVLGRIFRWNSLVWRFIAARWRRFKTPKPLRDADFQTWTKNLSACANCYWIDDLNRVHPSCDICGCQIEFKTRWMSEKCPIGEWDNTVELRERIRVLANQQSQPTSQPHHNQPGNQTQKAKEPQ